jgi:type VI secretion system Hcp family effector
VWKPIQISKQWGAASPQILQALATNEVLNPVIVEFTRTTPDGKEQVYQRVTLTNALVVDVERSLDLTGRH